MVNVPFPHITLIKLVWDKEELISMELSQKTIISKDICTKLWIFTLFLYTSQSFTTYSKDLEKGRCPIL